MISVRAHFCNKPPIGMSLSLVEREYLRLLKPELHKAIEAGEPDRAASFAKEIARLQRKAKRANESKAATDRGAAQ